MSEFNAKVMYLRLAPLSAGREPVLTLAHSLEKTEEGKFYARVGYALYHYDVYHDDHFSRKIGRSIAIGRLENTKSFLTVEYPATATTWSQRMSVLLTVLRKHTKKFGEVEVPSRLSKAVTQYLAVAEELFDTVPVAGVNT